MAALNLGQIGKPERGLLIIILTQFCPFCEECHKKYNYSLINLISEPKLGADQREGGVVSQLEGEPDQEW